MDWPKWDLAIKAELEALKKAGTWGVVERPRGRNIVVCKWVLHIKNDAARRIERYKAWLVVKWFTQVYGVDYYETFAPVTKLASTTQPGIGFPIGILSQFVDNLGWAHWEGVKHIFRYLAGTRNWALVYGMKVKGLEGLLMWTVLCRSIGMLSPDTHSWSMGEPFPGLPRNKKSSRSPPSNQNMWPLHTLPRRPYGFAYHFIQTRKLLSHLPAMGLITPISNTSTYGIILFDSSWIMGQLILFIALPTTWLTTHLPRCFPTLKQSISLSRSACNRLEGGVLEYSRSIIPTAKFEFPYMVYKYVHAFYWLATGLGATLQ